LYNEHMTSQTFFSRGFVSLGGGYVRIWRPGEGLIVELPCCVVVKTEDGSVLAIGEDAAHLEGKLPPGTKIVRPFWSERIIDRTLLRVVLQEALRLDRASRPKLWERLTLQYSLILGETTPALHKQWLRKTADELWPWPWKEIPALRAVVQGGRKKIREDLPLAVIDCGFSSLRGAVLVGQEVLPFTHEERLGLSALCHDFAAREREAYDIMFAPSLFYAQEWGVRQAGLRVSDRQPVLQPPHRETFIAFQKDVLEQFCLWLETQLIDIPSDIKVSLQHEGLVLVGGAAEFFAQEGMLQKRCGLPIHVEKTRFALGGE
jgi:hypothetical protein